MSCSNNIPKYTPKCEELSDTTAFWLKYGKFNQASFVKDAFEDGRIWFESNPTHTYLFDNYCNVKRTNYEAAYGGNPNFGKPNFFEEALNTWINKKQKPMSTRTLKERAESAAINKYPTVYTNPEVATKVIFGLRDAFTAGAEFAEANMPIPETTAQEVAKLRTEIEGLSKDLEGTPKWKSMKKVPKHRNIVLLKGASGKHYFGYYHSCEGWKVIEADGRHLRTDDSLLFTWMNIPA